MSGARRLVGRVVRSIRPAEGEAWDRAAGVSTERFAEIDELTVDPTVAGDGHAYVPTPPRLARTWLDRLDDALVRRSTFVDLGSGRGRVLLMAAEKPFRRVRGVEFAAELHDDAARNIAAFPSARRRCDDVASLHGDAGVFEFPEEPLVVYLDNPFSERVMARVIEALGASHARRPRPITVVYQQLREEDSPTGNLRLLDAAPFLRGEDLRYRWRDRPFLSPFLVRLYSTADAAP